MEVWRTRGLYTGYMVLALLLHLLFWSWMNGSVTGQSIFKYMPREGHPLAVSFHLKASRTNFTQKSKDRPSKKAKNKKYLEQQAFEKTVKHRSANNIVGVTRKAHAKGTIIPSYPKRSRLLGEEGQVKVSALISSNGKVTKIIIVQSSGFTRLDNAAIEAIRKSQFEGAQENGKKVNSQQVFIFNFSLEEAN